jgi:hypothetical protein
VHRFKSINTSQWLVDCMVDCSLAICCERCELPRSVHMYMLRHKMHGAAQRRRRESFRVSKEFSAVCA